MGGSTMERFNVRTVVQIRKCPHPKDFKTLKDRGVAENAMDFQWLSPPSSHTGNAVTKPHSFVLPRLFEESPE
jgi:hypothetical protein